jgi:hypothetical protein
LRLSVTPLPMIERAYFALSFLGTVGLSLPLFEPVSARHKAACPVTDGDGRRPKLPSAPPNLL